MNRKKKTRVSSLYVPAVAMVAAAAVLAVVLALMTYRNIQRERELMTSILLEKGSAVIRSLEAGTRTWMRGPQWGRTQVQDLMRETAEELDVHYLIITNAEGTVLIHSDPDKAGTRLSRPYDVRDLLQWPRESWHILNTEENKKVFEVAREFRPVPRHIRGSYQETWWRRRMMEMHHSFSPSLPPESGPPPKLLAFVGLKMDPFEAIIAQYKRRTILTGIVLLLAGSAAIFTIFIIQSNQTVHRALQQVQTYADSIVANLPAGLISIDHEGRIVSINRAGQEILGKKGESLVGLPLEQVIPEHACPWHAVLSRGHPLIEKEVECIVEGDTTIPLSFSATGISDEQGRITGAVVIFRDLRELRRLQEEVRRSERMASLGAMAAGIAHEIRNPLSSIKGLARYLGDRFAEDSEERRYASIMADEVDRLNRAVTELLEFARPADVSLRPFEMRPLLEHSLRLIRSDAERKGVRTHVLVEPETLKALVDGDRVIQALLNIYQNSLAAMEHGGVLNVSALSKPEEGMVEVRVEDTGCGIPPENLGRIFDPYFSTRKDGTGLGLAIVHKIVEAHRGQIHVESSPGRGTTFSLLFPAAQDNEPEEITHE